MSQGSTKSAEHPVIIIGAGPAGLACGACLEQRGVPSVLLERAGRVGSRWHNHYQRLHLHTARSFSHLPGLKIPKQAGRYPSRQAVCDYLRDYAEHFALDIRLGTRVEQLEADSQAAASPGAWRLRCSTTKGGQDLLASQVIIATGSNDRPNQPDWPGLESFAGELVHSASYRDGKAYAGKRVLVVGLGNSGGEIALDLAEHGARVEISVRSAVNVIPREIFGIPNLALSIPMSLLPARMADWLGAPIVRRRYPDLEALGLPVSNKGPLRQIREDKRIPLIDIGTIDLLRSGAAQVRSGVASVYGARVSFSDGSHGDYDAIIAATGFHPGVARLLGGDALLDEQGMPRVSGAQSSRSGLWFCGFHISPKGMLREIGIEARRIARQIAAARRAERH